MLGLPPSVRIFLCLEVADMRRSFDGLAGMVENVVGLDPFSGYLFVFRNRRGDRVKILYWDRDGYAIWYKRLEKGVFRFPRWASDSSRLEITAADLSLVLEGIDVLGVKRQKRYVRRNISIQNTQCFADNINRNTSTYQKNNADHKHANPTSETPSR